MSPDPKVTVGQEYRSYCSDWLGQEEDHRKSQEAGFDHHMVKPVDPRFMMKLLADLQVSKQ